MISVGNKNWLSESNHMISGVMRCAPQVFRICAQHEYTHCDTERKIKIINEEYITCDNTPRVFRIRASHVNTYYDILYIVIHKLITHSNLSLISSLMRKRNIITRQSPRRGNNY